ncbi:hypothetical protein OSCI_3510040 [Kamptonema sp. PCC 6506]|nr:hypothetical protein OSCI_3510040 [Kamptonema sp. PCC 6506]
MATAISEKYWGQPESNTGMLNATSLKKYKKMLDAYGNWS